MKKYDGLKNSKFLSFFIIFTSAAFFSCIAIILSLIIINNNSIYDGIYVEGVNVSGLTVIEANTKVEEILRDDVQNNKLKLRYGDRIWVFSRDDIGLKYDFAKAINEALQIGRNGSYFDRITSIIRLLKEPQSISIKSQVDANALNSILDLIEDEVYTPGVEAKIERKNGQFLVYEGAMGISLNKEKTYSEILNRLNDSKYNDIIELDVSIDTISPKYSGEVLSEIKDLLGSYSTQFNASVKGRTNNIKLSSKAIDGSVLLPGEIFSFNNIVGPRSASKGYMDAPVIIKGDLVDGLGGGICQLSSTIYNTVLRSGLNVVERVNHSIPSTYVPKGLDATVSYGALDFKFQNTTGHPVYLESFVKGNNVSVNIYGYKADNKKIKVYSNVDQVIDKSVEVIFDSGLLAGKEIVKEKGRNGYRVSSYMIIYDNEVEVERKLISKDYYRSDKRIVIKGTKKPIDEVEKEDDINLETDKEEN